MKKENTYYTVKGMKHVAGKDYWFRLQNSGLFESVENAENWFHAMKHLDKDYFSQFEKFFIDKRIVIEETIKEL